MMSTLQPLPPDREAVSQRLSRMFELSHVAFFGKARSGLAALLEVLDLKNGPLILPATICPTLIATAQSAKARTVLCDIDPQTGLMDDRVLAELIRSQPHPGIVMPVYLYGYTCNYTETLAQAESQGWFVLHNDTHGVFGLQEHSIAKTPNSALLLSFGHGKVIDADGGGAILSDDGDMIQALQACGDNYPPVTESSQAFEDYLTLLRRMLNNGPDHGPSLSGRYEYFLDLEAELVQFCFDDNLLDHLDKTLAGHDLACANRRAACQNWKRRLSLVSDKCGYPELLQPSPWRMIVRLPHRRSHVLRALRDADIDAGTNYPSVTQFFPSLFAGETYPGADLWSHQVLNLWLDERYDDALMNRTVEIVAQALNA